MVQIKEIDFGVVKITLNADIQKRTAKSQNHKSCYMSRRYVLLIEKEEMWARMLAEVLTDNDIPCVMRSVMRPGQSPPM